VIGILFATRIEAAPFLDEMRREYTPLPAVDEILRFKKDDRAVAVGMIGMGKQLAKQSTERFITAVRPDRVLNAGIAGALSDALQLGEVYAVSEAVERPDGTTPPVPCDLTGLEGLPRVRLVTASKPVFDDALRVTLRSFGDMVDMEGAVVAAVCRAQGIPCTEIKCISDFAAEGDRARLHQNIRNASKTLSCVLISVLSSRE